VTRLQIAETRLEGIDPCLRLAVGMIEQIVELLLDLAARVVEFTAAVGGDPLGCGAGVLGAQFALANEFIEGGLNFILGDNGGADSGEDGFLD